MGAKAASPYRLEQAIRDGPAAGLNAPPLTRPHHGVGAFALPDRAFRWGECRLLGRALNLQHAHDQAEIAGVLGLDHDGEVARLAAVVHDGGFEGVL